METIALKIGEVYTLENNVKIECVKSDGHNCCFCCFNPILYSADNDDVDNELTLLNCKDVKCISNERAKIGLEGVDVYFKRIKDADDKQKDYNKINNPFKYYINKTM